MNHSFDDKNELACEVIEDLKFNMVMGNFVFKTFWEH